MTILIKPNELTLWLKLTLLEPIVHGDPAQADKSNHKQYRRQLQRIKLPDAGRLISQGEVDRITAANPIPANLADAFEDEPLARFVATAITAKFIQEFGRGKGTGLFEGMSRYSRLEARFRQAAIRSANLKEFWGIVCDELKVGSVTEGATRDLLPLLIVPRTFAYDVLFEFVKHTQLIRVLAQMWVEEIKQANEAYAKKAGVEATNGETIVLSFEAPTKSRQEISARVPVHSGNDIRHQLRAGGMYHLIDRLEVEFESLPKEVASLIENGGAMSDSSPSNSFALLQNIREHFPLWGLLGGSTSSFILGESNLASVSSYFVGRENNDVLSEIGIETEDSVSELLDQWQLTRHSNRTEDSPMPYGFETIQKGAVLMVRLKLHPFIRPLEVGALMACIETFRNTDGTVGGRSAQGFGRVKVEYFKAPDLNLGHHLAEYEQYLSENRDSLRQALVDGTLMRDATREAKTVSTA